jgi:hypothetical protein
MALRSISPVEICGAPKCSDNNRHCVPLPAPWRPSIMMRTAVGMMSLFDEISEGVSL